MKLKNKLTLILLLSVLFSFAQKIEMEGNKFFLKGKQLSSRETKQLLLSNYEASMLFKKAKSKEATGGFLLGLGIGLTVTDLAIGLGSDVKYPSFATYIGVGATLISIPILSGRNKLYKKAVEKYNANQKEFGYLDDYHFEILANTNGVGFRIQF